MSDGIAYELLRFRTRDRSETTVYLVRHPAARTRVSVVCFEQPRRLDQWCAATGHPEAMVAGFFVRDPYRPLGEVRVDGEPLAYEPVAEPWAQARACLHVDDTVRMAPRSQFTEQQAGHLLQAGPCSCEMAVR